MSHISPSAREAALSELDTRLAHAPSAELRCQRAALLDLLGRSEDARDCYLAILADYPEDKATLNGLGALLHRTGYSSAARTVFARAVSCHPDHPASRVNLANMLRAFGDIDSAQGHLQAALRVAPDFPQAHQALGDIFAERGDQVNAQIHWRRGYTGHALHEWRFRGRAQPLRLLMLISVANGNIAARQILDDQVFAVTTLAMEFYRETMELPAHDLVLNAIGDADLCGDALRSAKHLVARSAAPIINHPAKIVPTGRADNAQALRAIPGLATPRMAVVPRAALCGDGGAAFLARLEIGFPVLLRSPGFHTGRHFLRADTSRALSACARLLPGEEVLAMAYLDARHADGKTRKGRVMMIDGVLYPLHWAVASDWKVHYFTADMADHPEHRAEEARFLGHIGGFLGTPAIAALREVAARLNLDYGGIDFAQAADGRIIVFEANATMAIVPPPPGAIWDYRRPAADLALLATRHMLIRRCGQTGFLS